MICRGTSQSSSVSGEIIGLLSSEATGVDLSRNMKYTGYFYEKKNKKQKTKKQLIIDRMDEVSLCPCALVFQ